MSVTATSLAASASLRLRVNRASARSIVAEIAVRRARRAQDGSPPAAHSDDCRRRFSRGLFPVLPWQPALACEIAAQVGDLAAVVEAIDHDDAQIVANLAGATAWRRDVAFQIRRRQG